MFCVKKNGKKYCVDNVPLMSAREIVEIQMNSMKNNKYDSGIKKAYYFASPANRMMTGPYNLFKQMVKNEFYNNLLNCDSFIISEEKQSKDNMEYSCLVTVSKNSNNYLYRFGLSRQYDFFNNLPLYDDYANIYLHLYWRTDKVILEGVIKKNTIDSKNKDYKNKKNSKKNNKKNNKSRKSNKSKKKKSAKKRENFTSVSSVLGNNMEVCSTNPMTGFYRDGYCNTGPDDVGTHVVCAKMTDEFLKYTKSKGNDLSTPQGPSFPGLKAGDNWCLCALRWDEANKAGKAPPVNLKSTNKKALDYVSLEELKSV